MGKVELHPRATKASFYLLLVALAVGVYAAVQWKQGLAPAPVPSAPVPAVTVTVEPSPLCRDAADSGCWETEDEQGPPWFYRDKPRVRM